MEIFLFLTIIVLGLSLYYQVQQNPATMKIGTLGIFIVIGIVIFMCDFFNITSKNLKLMHQIGYSIAVIFGILLLLSMVRHSWKKSHQLGLPLLVGIYLTSLVVLSQWPLWWLSAPWLMLYFVWQFCRFIVSSVIYGYQSKAPTHGPLVVLGGGLAEGYKVGNIVDQRIQAAVTDANKMSEYPMIVFSGGQGDDQLISEAEAMRDWSVAHYGVPLEKTQLENRSRNTYQNLQYSSQLLSQQPFTFYTSGYHVFRGVLLAKQQNIIAQGRGGFVPLVYRIPAFFREFAGVMSMNIRRQILWAIVWGMIAFVVNKIITY
ncbi:YdcF family protein [Leuconostoc inhae]|uniref:YdcF family protein n=1 Tax=Leuconostoc inhae TaxID=178001 RepID=UPI001C7D002C|nr:YdcF family protein [Leuconostoc inhae]